MTAAGDKRWTAAEAKVAFAAAPVVQVGALCGGGPVLVVAPHPDDESLGCGGLIACAADANLEVVVAVLTDGAASHPHSRAFPRERLAALRLAELQAAVRELAGGRVRVEAFGAGDGRLGAVEAEAAAWLGQFGQFGAVFSSWSADPHPDHKAAFRIAARQTAVGGAALFAYPVWGLTLADGADAGPTASCVRLDVSAVLDRKRAAILAHRSQTTGLIADDPDGFRLSPADMERHLGLYEVFIRVQTDSPADLPLP